MQFTLTIILSFFSGSIPFGLLAGKLKGIDIRKSGSGNIGATNALRALGPAFGIPVLVLDILKGTLPVVAAQMLFNDPLTALASGLAAILGHMYTPFSGFKGGKGVATTLGVLLGLTPDLFLITGAVMVAIIAATRYVSLGSVAGAILLSCLMFIAGKPLPYCWASVFIAAFIIYKHVPNMKRLAEGKENKLWGGK